MTKWTWRTIFWALSALALLGLVAFAPGERIVIPKELRRGVECELITILRPPEQGPSWCPEFGRVYDCGDRFVAVTQQVNKENPLICILVQVTEIKTEKWKADAD